MFDPRGYEEDLPPSGTHAASSLPPSSASSWRREVGRRMVAFVRAVGGVMNKYETTKHPTSSTDVKQAEDACDRALLELERLAEALRQLRRSLHA